jgi:integrase
VSRGEILELEWANIDFDNQTIAINKASYYSRGYSTFTDTPKSKTSYRCLKIPVEIVELLKRYRTWQKEYSDSIENLWVNTNRLFTSLSGTPMNPDSY